MRLLSRKTRDLRAFSCVAAPYLPLTGDLNDSNRITRARPLSKPAASASTQNC